MKYNRFQKLLAAERRCPKVAADLTAGLIWPNSYASGMSSLGFLWAHATLNVPGLVRCERYFALTPDQSHHRFSSARTERNAFPQVRLTAPLGDSAHVPKSFESGFPLHQCDLIAISISHEPDILPVVRMLLAAGIAPLARDRRDDDPFIIAGGPLTRANPTVLKPFCDHVAVADGEPSMSLLLAALRSAARNKSAIGAAMAECARAGSSGCTASADGVQPTEPIPVGPHEHPVVSALSTPNAALGDLNLVEVSRGCPKSCTFCIGALHGGKFTLADTERIKALVPADSAGIGLIGAAVSFHPGLKSLLEWAVRTGKTAGVSSLRADRLDAETLALLHGAGAEVLTVAADGASEAIRLRIRKEITEAHLVRAAELAREADFNAIKVYAMLGLPEETEDDVRELASMANRLHKIVPTILSLAVFVPKLNTPLSEAPFEKPAIASRKLQLLRKCLSGGVRTNTVSPREAWVEHIVSHASEADAERIVRVASTPGRANDWAREFGRGGP